MKSLEIAALAMQQDGHRLTQLAHNMANVQTPGYRRATTIQAPVQTPFASLMQQGLEAQALTVQTDNSPGKLEVTGRALDVALAADEYLALRQPDGSTALTRFGRLQADARGVLTAAGQTVQGLQGDIQVPASAQTVRVDGQGQVWADDKLVGQLAVVKVAQAVGLRPQGQHILLHPEPVSLALTKPSQVTPSHLEGSNVQTGREMLDLMSTMRHAETMTRLIQSSDELLGRTIQKFGEV